MVTRFLLFVVACAAGVAAMISFSPSAEACYVARTWSGGGCTCQAAWRGIQGCYSPNSEYCTINAMACPRGTPGGPTNPW